MSDQTTEFDDVVEALCLVLPAHREEVVDLIRNVRIAAWEEGAREVWGALAAHAYSLDYYLDDNPYRLTTPPGQAASS